MSLQAASGRLYVGMHPKGKEGSHKAPAQEIWVFDLAAKQRVARLPADNATVLATTRGDAPRLYALSTETGTITSYDAGPKPKKLRHSTPFSEFGTQIDTQ
jgi:methylamine dehydrogenase heavy chain